jgi:hypothetical protein
VVLYSLRSNLGRPVNQQDGPIRFKKPARTPAARAAGTRTSGLPGVVGGSDKRGRLQLTPRHPDSRRISIGNFQYLATAANAFDHAVKRRVLAIDWIVWITEALLVGHLIGPRLAVANRCLRQQLLVSVRRWRWCGWISRTNRLRNRRRSVDQGQQRYRRDQLSHDGSSESGAPP